MSASSSPEVQPLSQRIGMNRSFLQSPLCNSTFRSLKMEEEFTQTMIDIEKASSRAQTWEQPKRVVTEKPDIRTPQKLRVHREPEMAVDFGNVVNTRLSLKLKRSSRLNPSALSCGPTREEEVVHDAKDSYSKPFATNPNARSCGPTREEKVVHAVMDSDSKPFKLKKWEAQGYAVEDEDTKKEAADLSADFIKSEIEWVVIPCMSDEDSKKYYIDREKRLRAKLLGEVEVLPSPAKPARVRDSISSTCPGIDTPTKGRTRAVKDSISSTSPGIDTPTKGRTRAVRDSISSTCRGIDTPVKGRTRVPRSRSVGTKSMFYVPKMLQ